MTAPAQEPIPMRERLRTDYGWTERQRQVLDLMARGKTNTEIAEALGVSLAGAKWHVSEILSKLQAESREEAAEYWRRYNGLAPRFGRVFRGMIGAALGRWTVVAAAVAASAVIGATMAAIVWLAADDDMPGSGDPTPPATPTLAISPTPGPTAVPTHATQGIRDLAQAGDGQLPSGVVVYYYGGRVPIEGPPPDLRRAYRDSNGGLHVEKVYERIPGEGKPYWLALDATTGRVAVALCLEGYCGGYATGEPGSRNRLVMSTDGGMTWQDRGSLPLYASLVGFIAEGLVIQTWEGTPGQETPWALVVWPAGRELVRSTGYKGETLLFEDGSVATRAANGDYLDASGRVLAAAPKLPGEARIAGGWIVTVEPWLASSVGEPGDSAAYYVAEVDSQGNVLRGVQSSDPSFGPITGLSHNLVFLNAYYSGPSTIGRASILDLETGGLVRLADLISAGEPEAYGVGAMAGRVAAVSGAGDCLNVREAASVSAASLACFVDGVLLRDLGETAEAEGLTWLKVATPDGREGWASAEFLER